MGETLQKLDEEIGKVESGWVKVPKVQRLPVFSDSTVSSPNSSTMPLMSKFALSP